MFREYYYEKLLKLTIENKGIQDIAQLLLNEKPAEKSVNIKELPHTYYIVYCDCSDGDILDFNTSDAFYNEIYPQVIFVDPNSEKNIWTLIAHEIIHDIQHQLYLWFDSAEEVPYEERWEEKMAYKFQEEVKEIILKNKISYRTIKKEHEKIEKFLLNRMDEKKVENWLNAELILD